MMDNVLPKGEGGSVGVGFEVPLQGNILSPPHTPSTTATTSMNRTTTNASTLMNKPSSFSSSSSSSTSMLSEKVTRALQVRTDTTAMKTALEALGHIMVMQEQKQQSMQTGTGTGTTGASTANIRDSSSSSLSSSSLLLGTGTGSSSISSTSAAGVRMAIEMDALQQAKYLLEHIHERVVLVQLLRQHVHEVWDATRHVQTALHSVGVGVEKNKETYSNSATPTIPTIQSPSDSSSFQQEQQLAQELADAFAARNRAQERVTAISDFLTAFHLSSTEQHLLEHYNFEDIQMHDNRNNTDHNNHHNGMTFLTALERLTTIRRELLQQQEQRSKSSSRNTGSDEATTNTTHLGTASTLRMMERLSTQQERAYERLYQWLQTFLFAPSSSASSSFEKDHQYPQHTNNSSSSTYDVLEEALLWVQQQRADNPTPTPISTDLDLSASPGKQDIHAGSTVATGYVHPHHNNHHNFVQRALQTLRHVPAFYAHLLDLVASSRRTLVTKRFLLALSSTEGYQGSPPLELQAHDPTRYVGEMLAFCWRSLCTEADMAQTLLNNDHDDDDDEMDLNNNNDKDNDIEKDEEEEEEEMMFRVEPMTVVDLLSTAMSGVTRPLKSRIVQVVASLTTHRKLPKNKNQYHHQYQYRATSNEEDDATGMDDDYRSDDSNNENEDEDEDGLLEMDEEGFVQRRHILHLYEICGLLLFYAGAVEKCLEKVVVPTPKSPSSTTKQMKMNQKQKQKQKQNPLWLCIHECLQEAKSGYEITTRVYAARLEPLAAITGDSEAFLVTSLMELLAHAYEHSPGFSSSTTIPTTITTTTEEGCNQSEQSYTNTILSMEWCTETLVRDALSSCQSLDHAVVLKQAVTFAKRAGMNVTAAQKLDEAIHDKEAMLIQQVVSKELTTVLAICGLGPLTASLNEWKQNNRSDAAAAANINNNNNMSSFPGLSQEDVELGVKEFYASLYSPPLPSLETTIKDPVQRKAARSHIAKGVCDAYQAMYESVRRNNGGDYSDTSFLRHSPDQVQALFTA